MRILRGLGSRSLTCGCFVGVYETYDGHTVEIVEERDPRCTDRSHAEGAVTYEARQPTQTSSTSPRHRHSTTGDRASAAIIVRK